MIFTKRDVRVMGVLLAVLTMLICGNLAIAGPPPDCGPCYAWDEEEEECVFTCGSGTCCNGECCSGTCCDGSCCIGTCCNNVCCPSVGCRSCVNNQCVVCGGDPSKSCCDGKTCYNPSEKQCCNRGDGSTCKCSCCNSWNCEYCKTGGGCGSCLRKATTYAELQACNKVPDPSWTPVPNGCSSPFGNNPTGCTNTSFLNACNNHDICYQTCGGTGGWGKYNCDTSFGAEMYSVCQALTGTE